MRCLVTAAAAVAAALVTVAVLPAAVSPGAGSHPHGRRLSRRRPGVSGANPSPAGVAAREHPGGGTAAALRPLGASSSPLATAAAVTATITAPTGGTTVYSSADVTVSLSGTSAGDSVSCVVKAARSPDVIDGAGTETDTFPLTASGDRSRCGGAVRFSTGGTYTTEAVVTVNGVAYSSAVVSYPVDTSGAQRCNGTGHDHPGCVYHWVELWYDASRTLAGRGCALTGACVWLEADATWRQFTPGLQLLEHTDGSLLSDGNTSDLAACLGVDGSVYQASAASAMATVAQDPSAGVGGGDECASEVTGLKASETTQRYPT